MGFTTRTRSWFVGYLLVAVLIVVLELLPWRSGGFVGLALAMPVLAGMVLSTGFHHTRCGRWMLIGIAFSWWGDVLGWTILIKIGFFLIAQICYLIGFWPYRRRIRRPVPVIAGYAVAVAVAVAIIVLGRPATTLLPAVVVYAVAVGSMAILAHGMSRWAAVGGTLFFCSDFLIGIDAFVPSLSVPAAGALIMISYLSAQLLLLVGAAAAPALIPARPRGAETGSVAAG